MKKRNSKSANQLFKELFNGITADDVMKFDGRNFVVGDKVLPANDNIDIVSGAQTIKEMYVWKQLMKDMKWEANKRMYFDSKTTEDILAGKMILWTIDVIEKKLENLSKIKWNNQTKSL